MKTIRTLSFLLLAFFACPTMQLTAQNDYKKLLHLSYAELDSLMYIEYGKGASDKAIPYMQAGREKAKVEFGEQDSVFAEYTSNLGFFYENTGQYQKTEPLYLQTMAIRKKNLGAQHPSYATSLNSLAVLYYNMGNYSKVEPLLLQSMEIRKKNLGEQHPDYATILSNLAGLYQTMGNYAKAEPLYLQAITIEKKALGEEHPSYAVSLNNLAVLYERMELYTKAESLYLQAISIQKKTLGEQHPRYANSLNNLAALYKKIAHYTKAEPLYLQALVIWKKASGEQHPDYATSLSNLANLYESMGNYAKAETFYLQALPIWKKALGEQHPSYILSLNNLANLYQSMGRLDTAFYYCQLGIIANAPAMGSGFASWENANYVNNLDTFKYTSNKYINISINTLLNIFQKQYDETKDPQKLEQHYAVSQAAIRLNERFRNGFTAEGDKLRVLAENNRFVLAAIKTGIELRKTDYEATTFGFAEMNKGILLLEASKTANAQQFGGLPDTLTEQETILQKKQSSLSAKLLEQRPETEKDSLRKVLNGINQQIDVFTEMLQHKYPKYATLKYGNKTANAKEIQALLDDKTALLEYIIGDSVIYIFYVDKKQVKLTPIYLSNKVLNKKIKTFHSTLSDYKLAAKETAVSYQKYTENAFWFYENLVAPALKNRVATPLLNLKGGVIDAESIKKLIIVSDGELGHLPFEAFLTKAAPQKETDYHELSYLANDYKISYNYSATLFANTVRSHGRKSSKESTKNNNNGQILAIASNYDIKMDSTKTDWRLPYEQRLREGLGALPAARKEIETLGEVFNGFFAFDKDASEKNFKSKAGDYAVIHLAMHGLLDAQEPILSSLVFTEDGDSLENNFLHAYEISKMKLNADLVVLSACETGYGKFEKGNGIASLAQAFAYAGAPSLIVSLWQVNDYATSEIMKNLYQNLADGMEKDEALQQAKIKYMKAAKGVLAHPAFWSPFILMGNTDAITLERTREFALTWIIGGIVFVLGAVFFALRRRKID